MSSTVTIEPLLTARLFLEPKLVDDRVYFVSDVSGRLSLHVMDVGGQPSEPLLPPDVALQNPHLMMGILYDVLPDLERLLVMVDRDGDENYQPMFVPLGGGAPESVLGDRYSARRLYFALCDTQRRHAVFTVEDVRDPVYETILVDLRTAETRLVARSKYQSFCLAANEDASAMILSDTITEGDEVIYLWRDGVQSLLAGTPPEHRSANLEARLTGFRSASFAGTGALFVNALVDDRYGLGYVDLDRPLHVDHVEIIGARHSGAGELVAVESLTGNRYRLEYNIDGRSWIYAGLYDAERRRFVVERTLCGTGDLREGVTQAVHFDRSSGRHVLSFSTARSPSQLFIVGQEGTTRLTDQRLPGIPRTQLSAGEDAPFESHDGLRISARLYLPGESLGFEGPHPVVFYLHGGPHKQERPDFTWFSMPLIQFFTLRGFAVFVPNARGSTGYGLSFTKRVDKDWGGLDRLDHIAAFQELQDEPRVDMSRVGVMGRSYGGYMTLNLVGRHPELWKAACSMFGPYDLISHLERVPETWKTYFHEVVGHPERDRDHLIERSPSSHLGNLTCPLLVVQGANDPRVTEEESAALVQALREQGKAVEYLLFDDEGHDVIKHANKVRCYTRIVEFFEEHL